MAHWKSINLERFRRLENLRLEGLGGVNLLVGIQRDEHAEAAGVSGVKEII